MRYGLSDELASSMVMYAAIGGIVGAKVYYAILFHDWHLLFDRAGLVWYGGLIGGFRRLRDVRHPDLVHAPRARERPRLSRGDPFTIAQLISAILIVVAIVLWARRGEKRGTVPA